MVARTLLRDQWIAKLKFFKKIYLKCVVGFSEVFYVFHLAHTLRLVSGVCLCICSIQGHTVLNLCQNAIKSN